MDKYYVVKIRKSDNTIYSYKRTKCLDYYSSKPSGCWQYSKQGAKGIAERENVLNGDKEIYYDFVKVEEAEKLNKPKDKVQER